MKLLIDGHNLIGQMPDISLADPDDEAKLVMRLRQYALARRSREVLVIFDHGVYGHPGQLDGYGVKARFARSPQDADAQLIRHIQAVARPREWMLVSSDRQVVAAAESRGMAVVASREFAARLAEPQAPPRRAGRKAGPANPRPAPDPQRDRRLSEAEIAEWLRLFGEGEGDV